MLEGFLRISLGTTVPGSPINFSEEVCVGPLGKLKLGYRVKLPLFLSG